MNESRLYYSPTHFLSVLILLCYAVFILTNHQILLMIGTEHDHVTIFSFQNIGAKSDRNSSIISNHHIIDKKVHPDNLEKTVRELSSFHNRHTESRFIDDVAYRLTEKLQDICGSKGVYINNFTYIPSRDEGDGSINSGLLQGQQQEQQKHENVSLYHLKNIACEKPGSTNNTIIISAHYDNRMEDINNSTARAPGADDNASGISALLEVARVISDTNLIHSIIFVLFSGEEQGKWGSTHYADYIDKTDVDPDLLINLDMIGFSSQRTNDFLIEYDNGNAVQDNDKFSQAIASFIKEDIAIQYNNLNTTLGILQNTDYLPFEESGYTVIGFHDNGVTKNPNYHKSTDTPDTLDYEYLASVTKLTLDTILSLDELITTDNFDFDYDYVPSLLLSHLH